MSDGKYSHFTDEDTDLERLSNLSKITEVCYPCLSPFLLYHRSSYFLILKAFKTANKMQNDNNKK